MAELCPNPGNPVNPVRKPILSVFTLRALCPLWLRTVTHATSGLEASDHKFAPSGRYCKLPHRFRRAIHAVDSSTIALVANCMDWARHRRSKAAAKLHMRMDLQSFLPRFAVVEEASHADSTRAIEVCAGLNAGEVVVFDKAYVDFKHLLCLSLRNVWWVTRTKDNMRYNTVRKMKPDPGKGILRNEIVEPATAHSRAAYSRPLRLVVAKVDVDGKEMEMTFISNNLEWAASSVVELYQARWAIEVFFKELKQTLKLSGFIGYSKNAIQWQVWAALLVWLLARFEAFRSRWDHSFPRLMALLRSHAWELFNISDLLKFHGTAGGLSRMIAALDQAYLPGLQPR